MFKFRYLNFATLLLSLLSASAQNVPYHVIPIQSPLGPTVNVRISDINSRGAVAATSHPLGGQPQGFVWKDGQSVTTLPALGGSCSSAYGVNDLGDVAGSSCLPGDAVRHAVFLRHGQLLDIDTFHQGSSAAIRVNKRDQLLGAYVRNDSAVRGFFWQKGAGTDLGDLGGSNVYVIDLGASGVITGQSDLSNDPDPFFGIPPFHGFAWQHGVLTDFGQIFGSNFNNGSGIDKNGRIVGSADLAGDVGAHAFIWDQGSIQDLGILISDPVSWGIEMNNRGQVVGSAGSLDTFPGYAPPVNDMLCPCRAVLWDNGKAVDLTAASDPGWNIQIAVGINDRGEIIAYAQPTPLTPYHMVLLRPYEADDDKFALATHTPQSAVQSSVAVSGGASRFRRRSDGSIQLEP